MKKYSWLVLSAILFLVLFVFLRPVFSGHVLLAPNFVLGPLVISYYGVCLAAAVLAGFFVARSNAWRYGLSTDEISKVIFWAVIVGFIGARIYYVVTNFEFFQANLIQIIKIWEGGLSLFGGLSAGLLFMWLWPRKKLYSSAQLFDLAALSLPLAQAIGRFGNLFNYETYGTATNLPWKFFVPAQFRVNLQADYFHPVFLYEAVANLIIFVIIFLLRGKLKPGGLGLIYLILYGLVRLLIEFLRTDSTIVGGFKLDYLWAVLMIAFGAGMLINRLILVDSKK